MMFPTSLVLSWGIIFGLVALTYFAMRRLLEAEASYLQQHGDISSVTEKEQELEHAKRRDFVVSRLRDYTMEIKASDDLTNDSNTESSQESDIVVVVVGDGAEVESAKEIDENDLVARKDNNDEQNVEEQEYEIELSGSLSPFGEKTDSLTMPPTCSSIVLPIAGTTVSPRKHQSQGQPKQEQVPCVSGCGLPQISSIFRFPLSFPTRDSSNRNEPCDSDGCEYDNVAELTVSTHSHPTAVLEASSSEEEYEVRKSSGKPLHLREVSNQCSVCLDIYRSGDRVTWSSNPVCQHAFHESCIVEWLVSRTKGKSGRNMERMKSENLTCPCCRYPFIQVDK